MSKRKSVAYFRKKFPGAVVKGVRYRPELRLRVACPGCGRVRWIETATLQRQCRMGWIMGRCASCFRAARVTTLADIQKTFPTAKGMKHYGAYRNIRVLISCPGSGNKKCGKMHWVFISTLRKQHSEHKPVGQCPSCSHNKGGHIRYGYRFIYVNGEERREHHVVMEKYLGRKLRRGESVHHGPGGRADNRIENLQLRVVGNHPSGWSEDDMANYLRSAGWDVRQTKKVAGRFHEPATWETKRIHAVPKRAA